ncbi:MAG: hypothetical protein P8179_13035 [Candidatus Thiodiazotropha sp.]|jgi:hypothetical protein
MNQEKSSHNIKSAKFPVIVILRWLLGIYLIGGCLFSAYLFVLNWASIYAVFMKINPSLGIYPMLVGWVLKLMSGGLFLIRSKWLLAAIPAWIAAFMFDFLSRNRFDQLSPEFYFAVGVQFVIFAFAFWLNVQGRLK